MFGFKKNQQPAIPAEPVAPVVEEPKEPEFVKADKTIIGEGITMVGDFTGKDPIVIKGTLKGNIVSDNHILVSKGGQLLGNTNAKALKIEGYVEGNMNLKETTMFASTGKMNGQLETARLSTDDGSKFEGTLKLNLNAPVEEEEVFEEEEAEAIAEEAEETNIFNAIAKEAEETIEEEDSDNTPKARAIPT